MLLEDIVLDCYPHVYPCTGDLDPGYNPMAYYIAGRVKAAYWSSNEAQFYT